MQNKISHPFGPVFDENSRILMLGTMPSPASRTAAYFYAHPQNRFWPVLCRVLGEPQPPTNEEKTALLLRRGIALWDTLASCAITGASDASIKDAVPNDFSAIFAAGQIRAVFTTGKKAGALYKKYCAADYPVPFFVLPSPSPANCAVKTDQLVEEYQKILPFLEVSHDGIYPPRI